LSAKQQELVSDVVVKVCDFRGWTALAVHVRTNHVHIVVSVLAKPEKMMVDFKAYATRGLRKYDGSRATGIKYWTQQGSTRYLWTRQSVEAAVRYVRDGQDKM
jgi:REP element-mobilizing transposase RayT